MTSSPTTLGEVLQHAEGLPWRHALYLKQEDQWSVQTPAMVLDADEVEEDTEQSKAVSASGFRYVLNIQEVQGIVANAISQRPSPTSSDLLAAFFFYVRNDAFIELGGHDHNS